MSTGADALLAAMAEFHVGVLFHLPGVETLPVTLRAVPSGPVRAVMVAHEQAAAFGAFGYARISGRPGVCLTVPGPGATNLVTGIAAARADQVPVVAVMTELPRHLVGTAAAHDCDLEALFASIVKAQIRVESTGEIGTAMRAALALSLEAPRGPVQLLVTGALLGATQSPPPSPPPSWGRASQGSLSLDGRGRTAGPGEGDFTASPPEAIPVGQLETLATQLKAARRPVLYVGQGVIYAGAVDLLQRLAERLGAGVVTDESARGILDERHPLSIGTASHRAVPDVLANSGFCLAIGARFSQWSTMDWSLPFVQPLVRIDAWNAPDSPKYSVSSRIVGPIDQCLAILLDLLGIGPACGWTAVAIATAKAQSRQILDMQLAETTKPDAHPIAVLRAIRNALPDDAVVTVDGSSTGTWAAEEVFPVHRALGFLTPEVLKELGSAIMVGIGAKLAAPDRAVIAIQGDGGFMFQAGELSTLMRESIALCIVVFVDGYYNADRLLLEHMFDAGPAGCALHKPDFVALAASFGMAACNADTPAKITEAVRSALATRHPTLIAVPIDSAPAPYRLQIVFDALKRRP
jgi:thiamine pyrophosphate-dependent acetolactate synthase large subunit-like protein